MKAAALIPCRAGSKGIPNKNFRELCGKPLIRWTIDAAVESDIFEHIIVSSDGGWSLVDSKTKQELNSIKKYNGILHIDNDRPPELATDEAQLDSLLCYYAGDYPDIELWALLQPTSPLRTAKDIQKAYKKICAKKWDTLVSVTPDTMMCWQEGITTRGNLALYHYTARPTRQQRIKRGFYRENGAIYFTKLPVLVHTGCRLGGDIAFYKMPKERSFEIDDEIDWAIIEMIMKNGIFLNG